MIWLASCRVAFSTLSLTTARAFDCEGLHARLIFDDGLGLAVMSKLDRGSQFLAQRSGHEDFVQSLLLKGSAT